MTNETRLKRLLYQSLHRGCKETDMILGNFASQYLHTLSDDQIDVYENFINEKDWDIYAWVVGSASLPDEYDNKVIKMIINFWQQPIKL